MVCYRNPNCTKPSLTNQTNGYALGKGADGRNHDDAPDSGGGGGFFGGNIGNSEQSEDQGFKSVSSSGSSYVSGFPLCNSVDKNGKNTGSPNHYSGLSFTDPAILNGSSTFPSPLSEEELGHSGDGAIKITAILFDFVFPECSCDIEYWSVRHINLFVFIFLDV